MKRLSAESVQGSSLTFQNVQNIEGCDKLSFGMLGVANSITDDIFQENLEDTSGFFVDTGEDTYHTASASQSSDCWLGQV